MLPGQQSCNVDTNIKKAIPGNFLVMQRVKDPVVSLQWLGWLLWSRFDPWPQELPQATGAARKNSWAPSPSPQ